MLLLFALFLYIFCSCYCIGKLVAERAFGQLFSNPFVYPAFGIIAITTLARVWTIFAGTGAVFHLLLLALTLTSAFWLYRHKAGQFHIKPFLRKHKLLLAVAVLFVLFFCAQQSISYDEALYHASFIEWQNQFGSIKGLANLHGRLAFNSNWHLFSSVFNLRFLGTQPFNQVNGFFLVWVLCYFLWEHRQYAGKRNIQVFCGLAILFLFFPLLTVYHLIDPSADYVVAFWTMILLYEVFFYREKGSQPNIIFLVCISVLFLFTVKLSAGVLLLLAILYLKDYKKQVVKILPALGLVACIIVPCLISNYLMSGYLVYPYVNIPADPWWKVPLEIAQFDLLGIKYGPYGRWLQMDLEEVARLDVLLRYKLYFGQLRLPERLLFFSGFTAYILCIVFYLRTWQRNLYKTVALFTGLTGFVLVMISAPDFRFTAGYIFFAYGILFSLVPRFRISKPMMVLVCSAFALASVLLYRHLKSSSPVAGKNNGLATAILLPQPYPVEPAQDTTINGQRFTLTDEHQGQFHWNTIPAMYLPANQIRLKDSLDISKGIIAVD